MWLYFPWCVHFCLLRLKENGIAGDGVVAKGQAYGMRSIRVDGNDTLAMYATIKAARVMAISESRPILIEV